MDNPASLSGGPATASGARAQTLLRWEALRGLAASTVAGLEVRPPLPLHRLQALVDTLAREAGVTDDVERKLLAIFVHNAAWENEVAGVPFDRRVLLLPQCLRTRGTCPAKHDAFGLLCLSCGRCVLGALQDEAASLGYAVLIAEGSEAASGMLKAGEIDAVIGVSCLAALEKTFLRLATEAIPAQAMPLLHDGCDATDVDLDGLRTLLHLSRPPRHAPPPTVDACRARVEHWFSPPMVRRLTGMGDSAAERVALDWLTAGGKRWRPMLAAAVGLALTEDRSEAWEHRLATVAVAAECFHKASLAHDDIEDDDDSRYAEPSLHVQHDMPIALNAGDLLVGVGYRLLATVPMEADGRLRMLTAAAMGHERLCKGQGRELAWRARTIRPASDALIGMFADKTSPAFEVAILLGAIVGGADAVLCDALSAFSHALGIAYQIDDDILDAGGPATDRSRLSLITALLAEASGADAAAGGRRRMPSDTGASAQREAMAAAAALRDTHRIRALDALTAVRSVPLKVVLTRLVGRMLSRTES